MWYAFLRGDSVKRIFAVACAIIITLSFAGCGQEAVTSSSNEPKTLEGYWERTDTNSRLYGMVIRVEKTDDGYVGMIVDLPDTAKDAGFKSGEMKWCNIQEENGDTEPGQTYYIFDDLTKNSVFKETSYTAVSFVFDINDPDELIMNDIDDYDTVHYRRIDYKK